MNQRQWIPMEESTIPKKRVIMRMCGLIVAAVVVATLVIGFVIGYPIVTVLIGAAASSGFVVMMRRSAESSIVSALDSRSANDVDHARLFNVIDGLCVVSGDQRPSLRVIDAQYPMAMAVALPDQPGTIIVSTGFQSVMERVEVEAVMAHLLWRIRTGEASLSTFLLSLTKSFSKIGLGSVARAMASRASDERVLLWADIAACQATRYPPALVSALEKSDTPLGTGLETAPSSLWFACPDTREDDATRGGGFSSLGVAHPSLTERIAVLKEI